MKYKKPAAFSNPHEHFPSSELNEILKVPDSQLKFYHYGKIYHFGTPAGEYSEVVYFLASALDYLEENPEDALECLSNIMFFISDNKEKLGKDGMLDKCESRIIQIFLRWTAQFEVVHFNKKACEKKQWVLDYADIVKNSQVVYELIEDLCNHNLVDWAEKLINLLMDDEQNEICSAWLIEFAREDRDKRKYHEDWNEEDSEQFFSDETGQKIKDHFMKFMREEEHPYTRKSELISTVVYDRALLQKHFRRIEETIVKTEKSPTYWSTTKAELRL